MLRNEALSLISGPGQNHDLIDSRHDVDAQTRDRRRTDGQAPTQDADPAQVRQFAGFLGRSLDTATVEDLRRYQWDLLDHGISQITRHPNRVGHHPIRNAPRPRDTSPMRMGSQCNLSFRRAAKSCPTPFSAFADSKEIRTVNISPRVK